MSTNFLLSDEHQLASRSSVDTQGSFDVDDLDFESQIPAKRQFSLHGWSLLSILPFSSYFGYRSLKRTSLFSCPRPFRRIFLHAFALAGAVIALVVLASLFNPSYTHLPQHYKLLRKSALESHSPGRGNPHNETIYIVASLYDRGGHLAGGQWGQSVLDLINLLGEDKVFLSIYENDSGKEGKSALQNFESKVTCNKSLVFEDHFDLKSLPSVTVPGGSNRIKRIDYLAEVRNRALRPLDDINRQYDKLLILNDIVFDPLDAINLLFSTNASEQGTAQYRAACAVDFVNPFKFYDTFATRDLHGYSMGVPFFPWFSTAGNGESRKDVLAESDAVRVRSCWNGMVAFDAKYFQRNKHNTSHADPGAQSLPARFRSGRDLFWEGSECCLIHADIQDAPSDVDAITDTGIYMNPFIRVAYDSGTLSWLWTTRRFERLFSLAHNVANHVAGLPRSNPRRAEVPGQLVNQTIWVADGKAEGSGSFQPVSRTADNDGFCFRRGLSVIVEHRKEGQKGWESVPVPSF